jgi:hypothetical protein
VIDIESEVLVIMTVEVGVFRELDEHPIAKTNPNNRMNF